MSSHLSYRVLQRARARTLLAPLVCLAIIACDALLAPPHAIVATMDADAYIAEALPLVGTRQRYTFRVIVRTENRSTREVALPRCAPTSEGPIFGVRLYGADADSRSAFDPAWGCVGGVEPHIIAPHGERVDTFYLEGPTGFSATGEPAGAFEGEMSLLFGSAETNRFRVSRAR